MSPQLLETTIGYTFTSSALLLLALTHRSFLNENRGKNLSSNERLEFLGDAIIETWASLHLYNRFPSSPEGELTNLRSLLVRTENLSQTATKIKLGDFLRLSRGEEGNGGRQNQSILADAFESLVGAIHLDGGPKKAFQFLDKFLLPSLDAIANQKVIKDPKSYYQEIAQARFNTTPRYQVISQTGPDHAKKFTVAVYLGEKEITQGSGNSKQRAEEAAAILATEITLKTK